MKTPSTKILSTIALLTLAMFATTTAANAQHGIKLAPGEVLVSVNGVPVQQSATTAGVPVVTSSSAVSTTSTSTPVTTAAPVSLAQSKANQMARMGVMRHLGGGFGGGRAEGVGMGSTREAAIRNCCYWGQRTPIDIGAATNGSRWYACVIYR